MTKELFKAFLLTFFAELGDKTQIIAMTFATQYTLLQVLLGVVIGVFLNHGIAIIVGRFILRFIKLESIQLISGFIFIVFAYMSLLSDEEDEEDKLKQFGPVATVALAFFLGELGDKTQIMAMTLSADSMYPMVTLLGTTMGMVFTSLIGIFIGSKLGGKVPDLTLKIISSLVFIMFGINKVLEILGTSQALTIVIAAMALELLLLYRFYGRVKRMDTTKMQRAAERLYQQTKSIEESLEEICLGEEVCGNCSGDSCLLGYIKNTLSKARKSKDFTLSSLKPMDDLIKKSYDKSKVYDALSLIVVNSVEMDWPEDGNFVINKIADYLEEYLFKERIKGKLGSREYINSLKDIDCEYGLILEKILIKVK